MIVSHRHKFIFIKTEKTAGTSVEIALSGVCGPRDIITPISPDDEAYRRERGGRAAQNYNIPLARYTKKDWLALLYRRRLRRFFNHMAAEDVRCYVGDSVWDEYFKFAFERNPFDKIISWYYWCGGDCSYSSIREFVETERAAQVKGFELYTRNSRVVVDKVYKFEELEWAMADVAKKVGLKEGLRLPERRAKGGIRKNNDHYRDVLSENERVWVSKVFARELAYFGYQY